MPKQVKASGKEKSFLMIHILVFALVTAITWIMYNKGATHWVYPWPAWTTAAWGLFLLGHFCVVFYDYEDGGYVEYRRQQGKA